MSVQLEKGGNINLSKTDPTLKNIVVGLGWDVRETDAEMDIHCLQTKAYSFVQQHSPG